MAELADQISNPLNPPQRRPPNFWVGGAGVPERRAGGALTLSVIWQILHASEAD